ncbi:hypothetical protein A8B78_10340 [Jannaschia sp. EhC01]|uniref:STAS domain-containing protein n=1 Tax=Gymnodinialimonas phycosphaerae TaxID=2841589 RepID=A0A975YHI4_9RHOB|nr:STAS domain-containing protein [Gymnodinialimonas phycosphaerae]MBY4892703.1 STAS domain-containing protein [Gymnodinialimonas phycosphaerae]OAN80772.1 hypothetical protein A8B78_10340 [Jannaschia sp. EhC01]
MTPTYSLTGHLDSAAAPPLVKDLLRFRGQPLCIDASAVTFAGALCVQVLVATQKQWQEDDHAFQIAPLSSGLANAARGLGVPLSTIGAHDADVQEMEVGA